MNQFRSKYGSQVFKGSREESNYERIGAAVMPPRMKGAFEMENTLINRVKYACDNCDMEVDSVDKLIAFAYYMGRESATRYVSDKYVEHIAQQRERAKACRYWHMAEDVIGPERYLYMPDYRQEITALFGADATQL